MSLNENDSFDIYYIKYDEEKNEYNTITKKAVKPLEDTLYLIGQDLMYLNDLNIKDFNFLIFEDDIEKLSDEEFEYFWEKFFKLWLDKINDNYLEIDLDLFYFQLSNTQEKKYLLKKIVHFITMFLPYNVIKTIINKRFTSFEECEASLTDLIINLSSDPGFIRESILEEINNNIQKVKNLYTSLESMTSLAKKNTLDDSLELLHSQLNKQIDYLEIFKTVIQNTDEENLKDLILIYIDKDSENLLD